MSAKYMLSAITFVPLRRGALALIIPLSLMVSCATGFHQPIPAMASQTPINKHQPANIISGTQHSQEVSALNQDAAQEEVSQEIYRGTGSFINKRNTVSYPEEAEGDVTLNFQSSSIVEVVKTILGDILQLNYAISDGINGTVSMRTVRAIPRESLIAVLDNLLRVNGAALIKNQNYYEVIPTEDNVVQGLTPSTRLSADRGYQIQIVPLEYIGAKAMAKILEPIKPRKAAVMVDEYRNILTIAGSQSELFTIRDTIAIFDVDQLKGMSVGLFRINNVEAASMLTELEAIFGDNGEHPLAGILRFTVIERLNALLAITSQESYLANVKTWIDRLDKTENSHGQNMNVYSVQNGKAEHLANLLTQLFEGRRGAMNGNGIQRSARAASTANSEQRPSSGSKSGVSRMSVGEITIIPDLENNVLLILAPPGDYAEIKKTLQKLDVPPMQVLVEATIIEVTLSNELQYGLQWFFKDSHGKFSGRGGLNIPANGDVSGLVGALPNPVNFTYAVFDAVGTRAVLNALAGDSRINVLSSPSLMVLNNHTATIRVGDQVPIRTSETTNTSSGSFDENGEFGSNITSRIQYRDTGISLEVTPRVNAGGMVVLEITQRVDDVSETTSSGIDSPTILQREITTTVAVQSGETIVLGGLIRDDKEIVSSGVPFLKDIPGLGLLFRNERVINRKTELVVLITPSAIANPQEARRVTEEYKNKLRGIDLSHIR